MEESGEEEGRDGVSKDEDDPAEESGDGADEVRLLTTEPRHQDRRYEVADDSHHADY